MLIFFYLLLYAKFLKESDAEKTLDFISTTPFLEETRTISRKWPMAFSQPLIRKDYSVFFLLRFAA